MKGEPFRIVKPDRYDIATEVLSSAVRVLEAAGFAREEISQLFEQVANRDGRAPVWIEPPERRRRTNEARSSAGKSRS
jgi:hypothetical protein